MTLPALDPQVPSQPLALAAQSTRPGLAGALHTLANKAASSAALTALSASAFPPSSPQEVGTGSCAASCSNDTACPAGQKCCAEGCCARCLCPDPAEPHPELPSPPTSPDFAPCPNQCEDDRTCPGDEKCCFTGCGLGCMSPYKGTDRAAHAALTPAPWAQILPRC
uniref:WAP domain-containing protein n=1 Tax=Crocodylus porosus TaxID=8502 RepID=A0A7M4FVU7_CROPO